MKVVFSTGHARHDPQFFLVRGRVGQSAEQPQRVTILLEAATRAGLQAVQATQQSKDVIGRVHTPDYLKFLEEASREWRQLAGSSEEVTANVHPNRYAATYPQSVVGRAGWHMADTACPIGPQTFDASLASAEVAIQAASMLAAGEFSLYALCRPPGHHAYADMAGGFCFLNNSAIAAEQLRVHYERVAILDIDVHHGNGTQGIFYERNDVLTISVHADPCDYYPFYWGHAHEHGLGAGYGYNLNLPLGVGASDQLWLEAIDKALSRAEEFGPDALVLALGLDAHEHDPLQGMKVSTAGFCRAGRAIGAWHGPVLLVQEGGYLSDHLGANLGAFLEGFLMARAS